MEPLAPIANPDLIGHEAAEATLLQAFQSGRMHHGWLLTGPSGIGKATLAHRFSRFLAVDGRQERPGSLWTNPADPVVNRALKGSHPDILTIARQENAEGVLKKTIGIDEIRGLKKMLTLTSSEGGWRVIVIDGAEALGIEAQNAILKVLEEPPPRTVLLLTSDQPGALRITVRSRLRRLPLEPLSASVMDTLLGQMLDTLPPTDMQQLRALADGSIGRAIDLHMTEALVSYRELLELLTHSGKLPARTYIDFAEKMARKGAEAGYSEVAQLFCDWLARTARLAATGDMGERIPGESAPAELLASGLGLERSLALWDKVRVLFAQGQGLNLDRKQVLLSALLQVKAALAA